MALPDSLIKTYTGDSHLNNRGQRAGCQANNVKVEPIRNIIVSKTAISDLGRRRIGGRISWAEKLA